MSGLGLAAADRHLGSVGQQELAVGDHDVALLEPGFDHRPCSSTVRSTLIGRTIAAPSLTTNTNCAGLAQLQRRRRNGDPVLGAQRQLRVDQRAGPQQLHPCSAWWRGSVTMPVAGSTVFSIMRDLARRARAAARNDRLERRGFGRNRGSHVRQVALRHGEGHVDRRDLVDGGERRGVGLARRYCRP